MAYAITTGATYAPTGGVVHNFWNVPHTEPSGNLFVNANEPNVAIRESLKLDSTVGQVLTNGQARKDARIIRYTIPVVDATTGETRYNTIRLEIKTDPRDTSSVLDQLRTAGVDILTSAEFSMFRTLGTIG